MKRIPLALVSALLLYCVVRLGILVTNFDGVASPPFELYPMGTMAELALRGVEFPIRYYYDNAAGQLVFGHVAIPFYALFGSTYFTLKLVPFTLGLGALVVLWWLLDRHHSRRAASIGVHLWALAVPLLTRYSITCSGNHFENLFFWLLSTLAFFELHAKGPNRWRLVCAGFASALSIFVFLGAIIPVGVLACWHLGLRGWRAALRDLPALGLGFALGIAPLIAVNLATSGRALGFFATRFNATEGAAPSNLPQDPFWERLLFFAERAPHAAQVQPSWFATQPLGLLVAVTVLVLWLYSAWQTFPHLPRLVRGVWQRRDSNAAYCSKLFERGKLIPWALYLPLFAIAFGLSNFKLGDFSGTQEVSGYRYFLPTATLMIVLTAIVVDRAWSRGWWARAVALVLLAPLAAASSTSLAWLQFSGAQVGSGWHYDGYNFAQMARGFVSSRNAVPREQIEAYVRGYPPDVQIPVLRGLGFNYGLDSARKARRAQGAAWTLDLDGLVAAWPPEWHAEMAYAAGTSLRWSLRMANDAPGLSRELARLRSRQPELLQRAYAGAATTSAGPLIGPEAAQTLQENEAFLHLSPEALDVQAAGNLAEHFAWGAGFVAGKLFERGVAGEVESSVRQSRAVEATRYSASYASGWTAGVAETQAWHARTTK